MNLSFFIARRYLAKQKGAFSSFIIKLAIVATALSVSVMILAMAIVTGFSYSISEKLYSFMGHIHVVPYDETKSNSLTFSEPVFLDPSLIAGIKKIPHVTAVSPFLEKPVLLQANGQMEGLVLKGVNKEYHFLSGITLSGKPIDFSDSVYSKQILLSQTTADRLNVNAGDTVQLDFFEAGIPRIRRVRISGIYHSGLDDVDKMYGVCDMRLIQRINNWSADSINGYQADLDDPRYADTVSNFIHYNLTQPPLESYTTTEIYSFIFDWLALQNVNSAILLVIMAIVATINMGAVLVILMVDRAKMIGILKALGMPYGDTRNIFLSIAGLIGATGILSGNLFAFTICWLQIHFGFLKLPEKQYFMSTVPIRIIWWQVAVIDIATLLLCIFCMWLPALYIRRIQPAKVLQFK
ncbi:MAG: ABC transporter permease [Chitinophagales bacterium]